MEKAERKKRLLKAAKRLRYRKDKKPKMYQEFSCLAIASYTNPDSNIKDFELRREYFDLTQATHFQRYNERNQLARQLAVLMFMEATS
jgi:hypothetical protein